jgi:V/A-type H+/Na+-transporting ATPase subunit I
MITPMLRIELAVRQSDRDRALAVLGELGVLHVVPVDADRAVAEGAITAELDRVSRALQVLAGLKPAGEWPDTSAAEAVREAMEIRRDMADAQARLAGLHRRLRLADIIGAVPPAQLDDLERAGLPVRLYAVADARLDRVRGELVHVVGRLDRAHVAVAVVGDPLTTLIPDGSHPLPPPVRDRRSLLDEAADVEEGMRGFTQRLAQLAHLVPQLEAAKAELEAAARWSVARRSVLQAGPLCGLQGWVPADRAGDVEAGLAAADVAAAAQFHEPAPGERPPTLIRYAPWAEPVRGLLDMLGTVPGYDEIDVSAFFMIALPLFAGMLIGDAGYGLVFLLLPLLARDRLRAALGTQRTALLTAFGAAALAWGAITGVWFGVTPTQMLHAGGAAALLGDALFTLQLVRGSEEAMRIIIIKICFVLGSAHLILAHARRALMLAPAQQAAAEVGWCAVLLGMVGLIWTLFFGTTEALPGWLRPAISWALGGGLVLVVLFGAPHRNPLRRVGMGVAGSLLPLLGTFSDTLSYIRLMAVGLASFYIGAAFNTLAASLAQSATWFAGAPVLLFGHLLNLCLVLIAIFAHGVRLNMLEFSSNAGVQWTGHPFRPFAPSPIKET